MMENRVDSSYRFDHVSINVSNFDTVVAFLQDCFGFEVIAEWIWPGERERHGFLDVGNGGLLEIHECFDKKIDEEQRMQHICIHVDNIQKAYQYALDHGARPQRDPWQFVLPCKPVSREIICAYVLGPDELSVELTEDIRSFPYQKTQEK